MNRTCREVAGPAEHEAAHALVQKRYAEQGFDTTGDGISRYLTLPAATTFGLFINDILWGTISVIPDGSAGLPMDAIYAEELVPLREGGRKIAEVVQFAVDNDQYQKVAAKKPSPLSTTPLFAAVLSRALKDGIEYLCISINPRHDRFYAMLGFEQIGALKHYDKVNAPAIARALHVPRWKRNPVVRTFLGKEITRLLTARADI